jgi:hypothetical protein
MSTTATPTVEQRADSVAGACRNDVRQMIAASQQGAVILKAIAGGGKSTFITETVGHLVGEARVVVSAPTNEQVFALVGAIARTHPALTVHYVPANGIELPPAHRLPNVRVVNAQRARGQQLVLGTLDKLGDAFSRNDLSSSDCLIIDEAYQADSSRYHRAADLAHVHLLVGDAGQIAPFTTVTEALRWRGLPEDPVRTAVNVVSDNPAIDTRVHYFPITRRLDARSAVAARSFYDADHEFEAAVPLGVRSLTWSGPRPLGARERRLDDALSVAGSEGFCLLELPAAVTPAVDLEIVQVVADLVCRALHPSRPADAVCERHPSGIRLAAHRVAVGASHNDQVRALRRELAARGHDEVIVETANRLQGLEFDLVIAWHPLAGLHALDGFHLESGRLCVMATRHRHACVVVGRAGDRQLLEGIPPSGDAWLGRDDEPILDGWDAHRAFYESLAPVRRPFDI